MKLISVHVRPISIANMRLGVMSWQCLKSQIFRLRLVNLYCHLHHSPLFTALKRLLSRPCLIIMEPQFHYEIANDITRKMPQEMPFSRLQSKDVVQTLVNS